MEKILKILAKLKNLFVHKDDVWREWKAFNTIQLPMIKNATPTLVSNNILSVQPLACPPTKNVKIPGWQIYSPGGLYTTNSPYIIRSGSVNLSTQNAKIKKMEVLSSDIKENIDRIKESITRSHI